MTPITQTPKKALNKAFLKIKPNRTEIEGFKTNLIALLDRTNDTESEEFHKNLIIDFLKKVYYEPNHFINTKGRNDLVIHNGDIAKSTVGVIIEAKKPTNKAEMITTKKLNVKAFQELVLYYLRERITHKNIEVKHLVATNINEWFIFDATLFDRLFAQNKNLVKQFTDFEGGRLADTKTDFFYKQIAEPFIADITAEVEFTYFNIQDFQKPLRNADKSDDNSLIALFKLLSPQHLLKLPFANDSNSLDKGFYSELLHIIGLTETKDNNRKLIERNKSGERHSGTILEDAIIQLDSLDKLSRLEKPHQFGNTTQERLFNVALELSITWINRILFLKLLEAQLITYHKGDKSYSYLNLDKIKNYDDLNSLFFQVLARMYNDRNDDVKNVFAKVPYLNSSLFEPTDIEQVTLFISNLKDDKKIPIIPTTVLKNDQGKKRTGEINTLEYLFEFLDAYDFSSEGSEEIQEDNKSLINASVLGLIFEKINGYKDGSFFTPGFITMYMCRETIRKAVVQKFNETKKWKCKDIEELYDKIEDRKEANKIVNSIKICDPAVGSGHFLVSALNEMIAVKNDLKILQDRDGKRLKEYQVEVVNDELIVTDEEGEFFDYNPTNKESQRIQEMLFHEKQTIIENCLFGVDINSNSVKICRLRLWIELLKNAYYKNSTELETLPNIDINIKCGNSLVSRFSMDADLSPTLKKSKWTIESYRLAVDTYRNAENKEQKREMEKLIEAIKADFRTEIFFNDSKRKRLRKIKDELVNLTNQTALFEMTKKEKIEWNERVTQLADETQKLEAEIEEIKANKVFENAFEWRFEFPEVLNDNGNFTGFDVVMGNPPYVSYYARFKQSLSKAEEIYYKSNYSFILNKKIDKNQVIGKFHSVMFFLERALSVLKTNGIFIFIVDLNISKPQFKDIRKYLHDNSTILKIVKDLKEWEDVGSGQIIIQIAKQKINTPIDCFNESVDNFIGKENQERFLDYFTGTQKTTGSSENSGQKVKNSILEKIIAKSPVIISDWFPNKLIRTSINFGAQKEVFITQKNKSKAKPLAEGSFSIYEKYCIPLIESYINYDLNLIHSINQLNDKKEIINQNKQGKVGGLGDSVIFKNPKIIVRQAGNSLTATYYQDELYLDYSLFSISKANSSQDKSSKSLELALAILNSKYLSYYAWNKNLIEHHKGGTPQLRIKSLRSLPMPQLNNKQEKEITGYVNSILSKRDDNSNQNEIKKLIKKIDTFFYEYFEFTDEEISIIEK